MNIVRAGGLLEFLQRIGGIDVHIVGGIDDDHAVAAVMGGQAEEAPDAPHLVDGQRGPKTLAC